MLAERNFSALISAIFRATAFAWVASKYPARFNELGSEANRAGDAARAAANSGLGSAARVAGGAAGAAASAVADFTRAAIAAASNEQMVAKDIAGVAVANVAASVAVAAASFDYTAVWGEVLSDIAALERLNSPVVADMPLWSGGALRGSPTWADAEWIGLKTALKNNEEWGVWIEWYEERLRGGSRGEANEIIFASVPEKAWREGPAAANAWIREHLPMPSPVYTATLREGLDGTGPPIAGPETVRGQNDEEAVQSALTWATGQLRNRANQDASLLLMRNGVKFDQRMIQVRL